MKKIDENFYGYIRVEGDTYTYNVSDNIVTLLPAQSDPQKRDDSLYRIKSHKTDTPEYLFGEDNNSMIAILRNGKFVTDPIGTNVAIRFATPIIIKACGNAEGFFNMLTEDWCKFHAITFCGGNINALYTPGIAIEQPDVSELLKYDGARTIKMRPWSAYTRTTQFQIENEKVTLTVSIGQTAETNNAENRGAYNLGKALKHDNLAEVKNVLIENMPEGPQMYPAEQITEERPEETIAELVRGAFLEELDDELPHSLAVVVDSIEYPEDNDSGEAYDGKAHVIVSIYVERDSQKPIIIGKGAEHLVRVKKKLRTPVNRIVGQKAKLDLHVKVAKGWQSDPKQLEKLGF